MARKTTEEVQEELKTLQKNYEEAVQVQKNIQDRAVAINAILEDRQQADLEKKQLEKIAAKGQKKTVGIAIKFFTQWNREKNIAPQLARLGFIERGFLVSFSWDLSCHQSCY